MSRVADPPKRMVSTQLRETRQKRSMQITKAVMDKVQKITVWTTSPVGPFRRRG